MGLIHQKDSHMIPHNGVQITIPKRTEKKWTILRIFHFPGSSSCHLLHSITQASLCKPIAAIHHLTIHLQESAVHHGACGWWGKTWNVKKCLCTIQMKEINISISFATSFPIQGSPVWRKRLKWSQKVTLKLPQLSLSPFLPPPHRGACRGSVENSQNEYLIFTPRLRDVVGISRREL